MLLEGVEVADGRRAPHGREQPHLRERVLGVLARLSAAGEERLQRLRRELDHAVALDPARPPPDLVLDRREHAELHGSDAPLAVPASGRTGFARPSV